MSQPDPKHFIAPESARRSCLLVVVLLFGGQTSCMRDLPSVRNQCAVYQTLGEDALLEIMRREMECEGLNVGQPVGRTIIIDNQVSIRLEFVGEVPAVYFDLSCDGKSMRLLWEVEGQFTTFKDLPLSKSACDAD